MPKPTGLTATIYRYRTEYDTPIRQSFAIGLGLYIGSSPFIGLHLLLALTLGRLFRLNRFKVYAAAHISNPLFAPFLYALEIQVGTWLRTGRLLSHATLHDVRLQGLAMDILLGSVVVGLTLGMMGALLTYWGRARASDQNSAALVDAAAERYLLAGVFAWELARGKLRMDPVYVQVIKDGRLPTDGLLLDLGCGQGLMLALIATARDRFQRGTWPASWPSPPVGLSLHGIETRRRVARRARRALEDVATIDECDLRQAPLRPCDAVLLFDVLHLLSLATQDELLAATARAMPVGGVLMIREADAAGGWKFQMVRAGNRFNAIMQGRFSRRFQFDTVAGWTSRLTQLGYDIESVTRHDSGPFANVLFQARLGRRVSQVPAPGARAGASCVDQNG